MSSSLVCAYDSSGVFSLFLLLFLDPSILWFSLDLVFLCILPSVYVQPIILVVPLSSCSVFCQFSPWHVDFYGLYITQDPGCMLGDVFQRLTHKLTCIYIQTKIIQASSHEPLKMLILSDVFRELRDTRNLTSMKFLALFLNLSQRIQRFIKLSHMNSKDVDFEWCVLKVNANT